MMEENTRDKKIIDKIQNRLVYEQNIDLYCNNSTKSPPIEADIPIPYNLQGTSITHDIYTHANSLIKSLKKPIRSQSLSDLKDSKKKILAESFENLDKPGGFRRYHVQHQNYTECKSSSSYFISPYKTRHFLDYFSMYLNKFAGEHLSDSEENLSDLEIAETTSLLKHSEPKKSSVTKTFFLLFKAFIGSGILFLPKAFSNGGLVFSILVMWLMGGISLYCFLLLLECKKTMSGGYGDIGGQIYGPWMRSAVLFSIAISQLGFMCGGTIFVVQNIAEAVRALSGDKIHLNTTGLFVVIAIIIIPLVWIRNIAKLSPTALVSDILIVGGLITLLVFDVIEIFDHGITSPKIGKGINWIFNAESYTVFIGTAVYSYEGIGLVIPIRDTMQEPEKFPMVLTWVMIVVALSLCAVGTLGYLAFGEDVKTVALLNLPPGVIPNTVQLGYALAVILSSALVLFPTIRIIEHAVFGDLTGKHNIRIKWQKNLLRASVVLSGVLIAWGGADDLDKFISLIGSVCCCPLSLIFPPLFHLSLSSTIGFRRVVDLILIVFGITTMIFTFVMTTKQWAA